MLPQCIGNSPSIAGLGALSSIGLDVESHFDAIRSGACGISRLAGLLGEDSPHADFPGAWIMPRELLTHRKWSPVSMAALHVAREAVSSAGWGKAELQDAALIVGTSRGNAAGWLGPWPGRRPFRLMSASNTIHSEPATAITIELGILGPNHVVASGCSAGLDALGLAKLLLGSGQAKRALVVAVDFPLVPLLLENYANSGLLGKTFPPNPFSEGSDGFVPGEGAAAIALSAVEKGSAALTFFANNSDGADPVGIPADGGRTHLLVKSAISETGNPGAICPHATGTRIQARAERAMLSSLTGMDATLHLLKPYFGHTVGASGLIESAVLLRFMREGQMPPNLPGTEGAAGMDAPVFASACRGPVFKLAHGMGGHNALAVFEPTP